MKHYFIFGEQACSIYDEYGVERLIRGLSNETIDVPDWFIFEDGVTSAAVLLNNAIGYERYAEVTKEEFEQLFGTDVKD